MKTVSSVVAATLLAAGMAFAEDEQSVDFDRYDADGDGYLSEEEWREIDFVTVDFATVDMDRDGQLNRNEVRQRAEGDAPMRAADSENDIGMRAEVTQTDTDEQDASTVTADSDVGAARERQTRPANGTELSILTKNAPGRTDICTAPPWRGTDHPPLG